MKNCYLNEIISFLEKDIDPTPLSKDAFTIEVLLTTHLKDIDPDSRKVENFFDAHKELVGSDLEEFKKFFTKWLILKMSLPYRDVVTPDKLKPDKNQLEAYNRTADLINTLGRAAATDIMSEDYVEKVLEREI